MVRAAVLIISTAASVACGGQPQAATSSGSIQSPAPTVASQSASSGPPRAFTIVLNPENGGTIEATLKVTVESTGYTFHVTGAALHPSSRYLVNTHGGTCAAEDVFAATQPVGSLAADGAGNGTLDRTYGRPYSGGGIITVHGYDGSGSETTHIACAELPTG